MTDLRQQLGSLLQGRVCVVGLGNVERGDDGFGVRLAETLAERWEGIQSALADTPGAELSPAPADCHGPAVLIAATQPERWVTHLSNAGFDHVIFLDAIEFGGPAGAVVFLDANETAARYPQISTHKISLGLLATLIVAGGRTKVWLLGAQPAALRSGHRLTPAVAGTLQLLAELFAELIAPVTAGTPKRSEVLCH